MSAQDKTELCKHGPPMSEACRRLGCSYAHALGELRIGPRDQGQRYERGVFCRFIGQTLCTPAHEAVLRYFDYEAKKGIESPPWAHCYAWSMRGYHIAYKANLGDFNIRQDFDRWAWPSDGGSTAYRSSYWFYFPTWLSEMLTMRRNYLQNRDIDPAVLSLRRRCEEMTRRLDDQLCAERSKATTSSMSVDASTQTTPLDYEEPTENEVKLDAMEDEKSADEAPVVASMSSGNGADVDKPTIADDQPSQRTEPDDDGCMDATPDIAMGSSSMMPPPRPALQLAEPYEGATPIPASILPFLQPEAAPSADAPYVASARPARNKILFSLKQ